MTATADLADAKPATGIVWAYRFAADGAAELIPHEEVDAALAAHGVGWTWIHLALADARCRTWITQQLRPLAFASPRAAAATCFNRS